MNLDLCYDNGVYVCQQGMQMEWCVIMYINVQNIQCPTVLCGVFGRHPLSDSSQSSCVSVDEAARFSFGDLLGRICSCFLASPARFDEVNKCALKFVHCVFV